MKAIKELVNVAIYLRKSRFDDETEAREETLARHERMLLDYCKSNNLIVKKIYKEVVSGENIENRPQMQMLLDDVENKLYDGVVVIEIERLSRGNQIDQAEITDIFKKSNTKIYTLSKVYDLSREDELDEDFFEFSLFLSRREYKSIKRRLIRGKKQAQKEGYFVGAQLPFGYSKIKYNRSYILVPNEQAEIVKFIFNKFVYEGYSFSDLRKYLNNLKVHSDSFKINEWDNTRLRRILKNKVYIGYINCDIHKKTKTSYKGLHESIIDDNTFELAQEKLKQASVKTKRDKELKNPLASLLKCSICGRTLQRYNHHSGKYVFNCRRFGCPNVSSYVEEVEKKLLLELESELKNFNYFLDNYSEEIENKKYNIKNEKELLLKEINKKENMINKCCELLEEGVYSKEKYFDRVNTLEKELNALKSNYESLNDIVDNEDEKIIKTIPILENVLKEYWNLTAQQKNDLLKSFIDRIEYTKSKANARSRTYCQNLDLITLKIFLKI